MWIFSEQAVPQELLEAARVDGASEFRTFWQISLPLLAPGIVTTALFTIVATWNNYFLPLIMLKDADWYPLTIGLNQWKDQASTAGGQAIQNLVITGSLITIIPLVIAFLCLQKYWQSGLAAAPSRSDRTLAPFCWRERDKGITTNRRRHLCRYSHC